jgi:uncharacterized protein (DUF427 family)
MQLTVKERVSGRIIAQAAEPDGVRVFEGNWYFAPEAVNMEHLKITERTYTCPYKGVCFWIDLQTDAGNSTNVGWVYRDPKPGYEFIRDHIGMYARDTAGTTSSRSTETDRASA